MAEGVVSAAAGEAACSRRRRIVCRHGSVALALAVVTGASCAHSPGPTPPPPATLSLVCPASPVAAQAADGGPVPLTLTSPTAVGGTLPIAVDCKPGLLGPFPLGTTNISCTAVDSGQPQQSAACSVSVIVAPPPPKLSVTKFMAFGDSLTEGKVKLGIQSIFETPESYTVALRGLFASTYPAQSITLSSEGAGGELATLGGLDRFPIVLGTDQPQVVLLQEGTNDLNDVAADAPSVRNLISALSTMVGLARKQGATVILSTIPPLSPSQPGSSKVDLANSMIRAMATNDVIVVDLFAALGGDPAGALIGPDGIHLTAQGYQVMANLFFSAIRQKFEVVTAVPAGASMSAKPSAAQRLGR